MRLFGFKLTEDHVEQLMRSLSSLAEVHFDISTNIELPEGITEEELRGVINKKLLPCVQEWLDNADIKM